MDRQIESGITGMDLAVHGLVIGSSATGAAAAADQFADEAETDLRRGPWTVEEDLLLVNYIAVHGEGRWNSLARSAGLKRSGKSCRLRWLNYLHPDVRRGNITAEEQLIILELQSRWGNKWSKIAQHLPGRTDNEIKNYWRTRVQKHAKQLKCDVNSQQFRDAVRYIWMPRLMERIRQASASSGAAVDTTFIAAAAAAANPYGFPTVALEPMQHTEVMIPPVKLSPDRSSMEGSPSDSSAGTQLSSPPVSDLTDCYAVHGGNIGDYVDGFAAGGCSESLLSPCGYLNQGFPDFEQSGWGEAGGFSSENLWAADGVWFLQQQ